MYAAKLARFTKPGRILDVGAACGFTLKAFTDQGWSGIGLEPNGEMARIAKERLGVDVHQGFIGELLDRSKIRSRYDAPGGGPFLRSADGLQTAYDLLNVNGLLLIESWNSRSLSARILGRHWHEYSPPSVLQWFSLQGMSAFLEGLGFEKVASAGRRKNKGESCKIDPEIPDRR